MPSGVTVTLWENTGHGGRTHTYNSNPGGAIYAPQVAQDVGITWSGANWFVNMSGVSGLKVDFH